MGHDESWLNQQRLNAKAAPRGRCESLSMDTTALPRRLLARCGWSERLWRNTSHRDTSRGLHRNLADSALVRMGTSNVDIDFRPADLFRVSTTTAANAPVQDRIRRAANSLADSRGLSTPAEVAGEIFHWHGLMSMS